jgi:hypothetical protein
MSMCKVAGWMQKLLRSTLAEDSIDEIQDAAERGSDDAQDLGNHVE